MAWQLRGQQLAQPGSLPRVRLGSVDPGADNPYRFQVDLDPRGASIYDLKLAGVFDSAEHKHKADKTPQELQDWSYRLLKPVEGSNSTALPFSTQMISTGGNEIGTFASSSGRVVWLPGDVRKDPRTGAATSAEFTLTISRIGSEPSTQPATSQPASRGPEAEAPTASAPSGVESALTTAPAAEPYLRLTKTYSMAPGSDSLKVRLTVKNISSQARTVTVLQYGPTGIPQEDFRSDERNVCYGQLIRKNAAIAVPRFFADTELKKAAEGTAYPIGDNGLDDPTVWAAQTNRFFACAMYPTVAGLDGSGGLATNLSPDKLVVPKDQYAFEFFRQVVGRVPDGLNQLLVFHP